MLEALCFLFCRGIINRRPVKHLGLKETSRLGDISSSTARDALRALELETYMCSIISNLERDTAAGENRYTQHCNIRLYNKIVVREGPTSPSAYWVCIRLLGHERHDVRNLAQKHDFGKSIRVLTYSTRRHFRVYQVRVYGTCTLQIYIIMYTCQDASQLKRSRGHGSVVYPRTWRSRHHDRTHQSIQG